MDEPRIEAVELTILGLAAAIFAGAIAFALQMAGFDAPIVAGSAAGTSGILFVGLRALPRGSGRFALPAFSVPGWTEAAGGELQLAEADIVGVAELLLDEPVGHARESRVVALFGGSPLPTPGEMRAAIDRHLQGGPHSVPDAAQALSDALAELRRSLR